MDTSNTPTKSDAPINPFADELAKMITAEASLTIVTMAQCVSTLDYGAGSPYRGPNHLEEIYTGGDSPPYTSVWKRGDPRLKINVDANLDIQTLHFRFKSDILHYSLFKGYSQKDDQSNLHLLNKTLLRSPYRYNIQNIRRPGQAIGDPDLYVQPTSAEVEKRIKNVTMKTSKAVSSAAEKAAEAAAAASKAASLAVGLTKGIAKKELEDERAAEAQGKDGMCVPFVDSSESDPIMPPNQTANGWEFSYKIQTGADGKFYADFERPKNGGKCRITAATKPALKAAVANFAKQQNGVAREKVERVNTSAERTAFPATPPRRATTPPPAPKPPAPPAPKPPAPPAAPRPPPPPPPPPGRKPATQLDNEKDKYYSVLGLSPGASQKDIRAAYMRLVKSKQHPNQGGDSKKFAAITEAYRELTT